MLFIGAIAVHYIKVMKEGMDQNILQHILVDQVRALRLKMQTNLYMKT